VLQYGIAFGFGALTFSLGLVVDASTFADV
jgi:hypothetical protein